MSTLAGLLFLVGGFGIFICSILLLVLRERWPTRTPNRTVAHFERSRTALGKIHQVQTRLRDSSRARARAMHPADHEERPRRSA